MRILVTGSSGFIGAALVNELLKSHDVIGYDLNEPRELPTNPEKFTFVQGDINDKTSLKKSMKGIEVVFHLAALPKVGESAEFAEEFFKTNTKGTFSLLMAARKTGVKRVIFASSSAVYGRGQVPSIETQATEPISIYAADKAAGEAYSIAVRELGLETVILRLFNVYGKGADKGVMYDFTRSLLKSPDLKILGDGRQEKDFIHIRDTVSAFTLALNLPQGIYNVGSGEKTSIMELAKTIADELKVSPNFSFSQKSWIGDVFESQANTEKLKQFGWLPKTSIDKGLREYVGWVKSTYT